MLIQALLAEGYEFVMTRGFNVIQYKTVSLNIDRWAEEDF